MAILTSHAIQGEMAATLAIDEAAKRAFPTANPTRRKMMILSMLNGMNGHMPDVQKLQREIDSMDHLDLYPFDPACPHCHAAKARRSTLN